MMTELPTATNMQWINALSTRPSLEAAIAEVVEQAQAALGDMAAAPADLGILFVSSAFTSDFPRVLPLLREQLPINALIGCSGGGIVGMDNTGTAQELIASPAVSLTLARLPGVQLQTFHLRADDLPDLDSSPSAWVDVIGVAPETQPQFIVLADPFSSGINDLLQGLDFAYPGQNKVGGLASTTTVGNAPGLFCDRDFYQAGVVGLALAGNVQLDTIVAQGCRPIGEPYRVAEGERNILVSLEDHDRPGLHRPPLEMLQEIFQTLDETDRQLAQHSLFIGVAQSGFKQQLEPGDFLIRNLIGVDPKSGAIAIGDRVRTGQRIQFHLRDANTSADDLDTLLQRYGQMHSSAPQPFGALMFACSGRGEGLYGEPNFDSQLFHDYQATVPLSGFFCNGEIGPVGGTTFLHGYTSVFGICRQPQN